MSAINSTPTYQASPSLGNILTTAYYATYSSVIFLCKVWLIWLQSMQYVIPKCKQYTLYRNYSYILETQNSSFSNNRSVCLSCILEIACFVAGIYPKKLKWIFHLSLFYLFLFLFAFCCELQLYSVGIIVTMIKSSRAELCHSLIVIRIYHSPAHRKTWQ